MTIAYVVNISMIGNNYELVTLLIAVLTTVGRVVKIDAVFLQKKEGISGINYSGIWICIHYSL